MPWSGHAAGVSREEDAYNYINSIVNSTALLPPIPIDYLNATTEPHSNEQLLNAVAILLLSLFTQFELMENAIQNGQGVS